MADGTHLEKHKSGYNERLEIERRNVKGYFQSGVKSCLSHGISQIISGFIYE